MLQEIFRIPGLDLPIYGFGLMLVIGLLGAMELAKFLARRSRLDPEAFANAALLALLSGVIGARLSHVIENWDDFTNPHVSVWSNLWSAVNIRSGGLTFYGGFLLAFPVLVFYAIRKKVPVRLGMDIAAPCILIGLGFGRIGCFLNGCCYGAECSWGVQFPYYSNTYMDQYKAGRIKPPDALMLRSGDGHARPLDLNELKDVRTLSEQLHGGDRTALARRLATQTGPWANSSYIEAMLDHAERYGAQDLSSLAASQRALPVHPAQLYSAFTALLLAGLLLAYFTVPHAPGRVFALLLLLEPITRFLLEMLRVEPPVISLGGYGLSLSMAMSVPLEALGIVLWIAFGRLASTHPLGLPAAPAPAGA